MSSEIIYHQTVMRMPAAASNLANDVYFWLWQIGSSNCYEVDYNRPGGIGRRSRSWQLASFGSREQVMRTAIYFSGDCEGGMLKLRSATAYCEPETLIRSMRRLLTLADREPMTLAYKGRPLTFTLRSLQSGTGTTGIHKVYEPEDVSDFLADHPEWLGQRVTPASSYARVHGPDMR